MSDVLRSTFFRAGAEGISSCVSREKVPHHVVVFPFGPTCLSADRD